MIIKHKNIFAVTIVAITASVGYFGYTNHNTEFSDIQLENIEALALGEFIVGEGWECFSKIYDDVDNPMYFTIIRCNDCSSTSAVYFSEFDHCTFSGMYDK